MSPSPFTFRRHLGLLAAFACMILSAAVLGPACASGDTQTQSGSATTFGGGGQGGAPHTTGTSANGGNGGSGGDGGSGGTTPGCKSNEKKCDGKCVAIDDPKYGCKKTGCGACEGSSHAKATCSAGECSIGSCNTGFANCNGLSSDGCEVNTQMDPTQCGACGHECVTPGATPDCEDGVCKIGVCDAGKTDCNNDATDGCEADLQVDPQNCGSCLHACSVGLSCQAGVCGDFCPPGKGDCDNNPNNGCETVIHTDTNCGFCGDDCDLPHASSSCQMNSSDFACAITLCDDGYKDCDMVPDNGCEINLQADTQNCGTCGHVCPSGPHSTATCNAGTCALACDTGFSNCDNDPATGCEVQTSGDTQNCGTCNHACTVQNGTASCAGGACQVASCNSGFADCDGNEPNGCEINKQGDPNNCGSCGHICSAPHGTAGCTNGNCSIAACNAGFADCNMMSADGCEVNTQNDANNCGGCGHVCSVANGTAACVAGVCTIGSCNAGFTDCDGQASNGCEAHTTGDPSNCGTCGHVCSLPNAVAGCSAGACTVATCNPGWSDCDGQPANGCEINLAGDPNHCGSCNHQCVANNGTAGCSSGFCTVASCNPNFADCNTIPSDGCEVDLRTSGTNCGACGNNCGANCTGNVTATTCANSTCKVTGCSSGHFDIDAICSDGCECTASNTSSTCNTPTSLGTIAVGNSTTYTGNLPQGGVEAYLTVTFTGNTNINYHPRVRLTTGAAEFAFDVWTSCGGGLLTCGDGGSSTGVSDWEMQYTAGDPASYPVTGSHFISIPAVGTVIIHVRRKSGAPTCNNYTLTISN